LSAQSRKCCAIYPSFPSSDAAKLDFFRGNEMRCAGVEVLLLLRRGARQCDGRRTGVVGDQRSMGFSQLTLLFYVSEFEGIVTVY